MTRVGYLGKVKVTVTGYDPVSVPAYGRWLDTLRTARKLLAKPGRWSRSTMNLNRNGVPCNVDEAVKYSLIGALEWGLDDPNELYAVCSYLCRLVGIGGNLHDWHRAIESTDGAVVLADVLRVLDKAIKVAEQQVVDNG